MCEYYLHKVEPTVAGNINNSFMVALPYTLMAI